MYRKELPDWKSEYLAHLRQHVVRRAIYDAEDFRDAVRRQALLQRHDDRDAAADARLEAEIDVMLLRQKKSRCPCAVSLCCL